MNHPMIEKAALAILNSDRAAAGFPPVESRDTIPDSDGYVRNAIAVLRALRDPTPDMLEAGTHQYAFQTYCAFTTEDEAAARVWTSMIDSITGEG